MPLLASLPSPPTVHPDAVGNPNNRWNGLPKSETVQQQMELLITSSGNRSRPNAIAAGLSNKTAVSHPFPRVLSKSNYGQLGELLERGHMVGSSQMLCHYRNLSSSASAPETRISVICELGCCPQVPGGCCKLDDPIAKSAVSASSSSYHWVVALFIVFIFSVFISTLAMLVLYWNNRRHEKLRHRQKVAELCFSSLPSSSMDSCSCTPAASMVGRNFLPPLSNPAFGHFFSSLSPIGQPSSSSSSSDKPFVVHRQFTPPPLMAAADQICPSNLFRTYHHHLHQHQHRNCHHHSSQEQYSPSSSSSYHAPGEMFFRSSF